MPQGRGRRVWPVALLVAAAAASAACDVMVGSMQGGQARAEQTWTKTYTLAQAGAIVEIANVNGSIEVTAADGDTLDVKAVLVAHGATDEAAKAVLKKVEMQDDAAADRVRIEAKYPREPRRLPLEVTYTIRAPRTASLRVKTVNGRVMVEGTMAGVTAETTNGSIVGRALGGPVEAETTNGEIKVQMASLGADGLSLETTNGSIAVGLPADAKATVSARCVNGSVSVVDLPFEKTGEGSRRKLDGAINGGGPSLRLETVNGGIRVGRLGT